MYYVQESTLYVTLIYMCNCFAPLTYFIDKTEEVTRASRMVHCYPVVLTVQRHHNVTLITVCSFCCLHLQRA